MRGSTASTIASRPVSHGEAQSCFLAGWPKIEDAIFSKSRGEHFWIIVIETESVTMQCIADLVTVAEKL